MHCTQILKSRAKMISTTEEIAQVWTGVDRKDYDWAWGPAVFISESKMLIVFISCPLQGWNYQCQWRA